MSGRAGGTDPQDRGRASGTDPRAGERDAGADPQSSGRAGEQHGLLPVERPVAGAPGAPPLLLPDVPFPPYRFVPGHTPHPYKQAGGWAFGLTHEPPPFLACGDWRGNRAYLRGVDFFNRGWWWEAHEEWESLWHVCRERDPVQFDLLKGLIQLAACALNLERGHREPARRLLASARENLERARIGAIAAHRARRGADAAGRAGAEPRAKGRADAGAGAGAGAGADAGAVRVCGLDLDELVAEARRRLDRDAGPVEGFYLRPV